MQNYFDTLFPPIPPCNAVDCSQHFGKLKSPTKHAGVNGETTCGSDSARRHLLKVHCQSVWVSVFLTVHRPRDSYTVLVTEVVMMMMHRDLPRRPCSKVVSRLIKVGDRDEIGGGMVQGSGNVRNDQNREA